MRILVVGAGGFVGGWICEELAEQKEFNVVGCVRKWSSAVRIARRGIKIVQLDSDDHFGFSSLLTDVDIVANASMPSPDQEADLAARLYGACTNAGVRQFIQFSSAAVYGNRTGTVTEDMAPTPANSYGRGKSAMESRLLELAAKGGPQLFIMRPSIIYGPFSDAWTIRYAKRVAIGRWRALGRIGQGTCNLIHAKDVARSVLAIATAKASPGSHILNLNGSEAPSWNEYIERLGDALGVKDRECPNYLGFMLSVGLAEITRSGGSLAKKHFTTLLGHLSRSTGSGRSLIGGAKSLAALYPTLEEIQLMGRKTHYSSSQAERVLNFKCAVRLREGIQQSADWCKIHGVV